MIRFYADENFDGKILRALRSREVDVITAIEDHRNATDDTEVFRRAIELGRVLLSQDEDMLRIAEQFQRNGLEFTGLIYAHKLRTTVRQCIEDLDLVFRCQEPEEYLNCIVRLPL